MTSNFRQLHTQRGHHQRGQPSGLFSFFLITDCNYIYTSTVTTTTTNTRKTGHRYVFFFCRIWLILTNGFFYSGFIQKDRGICDDEKAQTSLRRVVWALGMFFSISFGFFYILTNFFFFYLYCIYVLKTRGGLGWTAMTKTGPNDGDTSFGLVGGEGFSFMFSHLLTTFFLVFKQTGECNRPGKRHIWGPQRHVTNTTSPTPTPHHQQHHGPQHQHHTVRLGGDGDNRPKWRRTRCLGHRWVFSVYFFISTDPFFLYR